MADRGPIRPLSPVFPSTNQRYRFTITISIVELNHEIIRELKIVSDH